MQLKTLIILYQKLDLNFSLHCVHKKCSVILISYAFCTEIFYFLKIFYILLFFLGFLRELENYSQIRLLV